MVEELASSSQYAAATALGRIDVHAHYVPDAYRNAAIAAGHAKPDGMPALPAWSAARALDTMDRLGIATAMLSISSPGVHFGDDRAARELARAVNEAGAGTVVQHPSRFGLFASLPLPDIDGALLELDYALDVLHADGVVLLSNQGGVYLGDARFEPVLAELNRRRTVVFLHPTSPHCAACRVDLPYPAPMVEFMFETTRAVSNLILSGTLDRNPNIAVIVPHAGAALPLLSDRIAAMIHYLNLAAPISPSQFTTHLARLHYDLAGFAVPKMIDSLLAVTTIENLLYGSDWPFTPEFAVAELATRIDTSAQFGAP